MVLNNRYRIVDLFAEGGMARVYRAHDLVLDRTVAVKVLREQYAADGAFLERFHQEARAAAGLAHPNIVSIYDVGTDAGTHYIVMELVEGSNLKQLIQQDGAIDPQRAMDIASQILAALSFAHERGIVHRDVKPQNILITSHGHAKVADFGIARAAAASHLTETGIVMGSVHYCAPEQAMGKGVSKAADVYAAGVLLYEMLTGHLPFESDNALGVALKHVQEAPPPMRQFNPRLSPGLESIVLTAMAKEPAQRYVGAEEMAQAINAYRQFGQQVTASFVAVSPSRPGRAVASPSPVPSSSSARTAQPALPRKKTTDWLVVIFGALIVAMIAGWVPLAARLYDVYLRPVPAAAPTSTAPAEEPSPVPTEQPTTPKPSQVLIPNVVGWRYTDAQREIEALGLKVSRGDDYSDSVGAGDVISQTIPADRPVAPGTTVGLIVSQGARLIRVPDVVNLAVNEAMSRLERAGLESETNSRLDDRTAQGRVITQEPAGGTLVRAGTVVRLTISAGRPTATPTPVPTVRPLPTVTVDSRLRVPDVVGMLEAKARQQIDAAGLTNTYPNYQTVDDVDPANRGFFLSIAIGAVVSQDPKPGTVAAPGQPVKLAIRKQ